MALSSERFHTSRRPPSISASLIRDAENVRELEDWGPCPEATGPQMDTRGAYLYKDDENGIDSGIWECTADGGEPEFVGPGDTLFIPRGWSGNWDLHETLRKLYVIF